MVKRKSSHYYLSRSRKPRKRPYLRVLLVLFLVLFGSYYLWSNHLISPGSWIDHLPLPRKLLAVEMTCDGQSITAKPGSITVLKADNQIRVDRIRTDGWFTWGVTLTSPDVDVEQMQKHPVVVRNLWPGKNFITSKRLTLEARFWGRLLGGVILEIQPGVKDLLEGAAGASDPKTKIAYLSEALRQEPTNVIISLQLAEAYCQCKDYEKAAQIYTKILSLGISSPLLVKLLEVYKHMNSVDRVLETYLQLLQLKPEKEIFEEMVDYMKAHKSSSQILAFLSKNEDAIPDRFKASLYLLEAEFYSEVRNWRKATVYYKKALSLGVRDPNCYYNLSITAERTGRLREAIGALKVYLDKNPGDVRGWFRLARLLEHSNDRRTLLKVYERLALLKPDSKVVEFNLGLLYLEFKMWEKAIKAFTKVAKIDARDVKSREYLVELYSRTHNTSKEERILRELIELEPRQIAYYKQLFELYVSRKDYRRLVEAMRKATEFNPKSDVLYKFLLYGYLKLGDRKGAVETLEKLISLKPGEKKYLIEAARLYEDLGNYEAASKKLAQVLKLYPDDREAQEEYLRLRIEALAR